MCHKPYTAGSWWGFPGEKPWLLGGSPLPWRLKLWSGEERAGGYLDGHKHLLLVGDEVVAFGQENLPEGALTQLPLQHDVPPLDVVDTCRTGAVSPALPLVSGGRGASALSGSS